MLIFTFITKHQNSQCNNIICLPTHALYYTFATCNSTISLVVILHVYTACWVIWPTTIMYQSRPYIFVMQYDSQVYSFIHQLNPITLLPIWIKSYLSLTPIYWYVSEWKIWGQISPVWWKIVWSFHKTILRNFLKENDC